MTVANLFIEIRYQMSDEQKTGYTDAELITYLNQTDEFVFATLIRQESNLALKKTTITLTDGEGTLPDDFELEDTVKNADGLPLDSVAPSATVTSTQYSVLGYTIYSDNDSLDLLYFYMPDAYIATTETLTVPNSFLNLYRQMIKFLAMNTDEFDTSIEQMLVTRFESNILAITGKRGNKNPKAQMPFLV